MSFFYIGKYNDAQIRERWVTHFMSGLTKDLMYYVKYSQVCNARPNYWSVDYPYMAHFTAHTQIHQVKKVPAHFPQYAYDISTLEEFRRDVVSSNIAQVTNI